MIFPIEDKDSPEVKVAKRRQSLVLKEFYIASGKTLKNLRELSKETAQRFGTAGAAIKAILSPYFSTAGSMGYAGGATTLSDGRYIFVHVGSDHYGFSKDFVEIVLCKSQIVPEGTDYRENEISQLRIDAAPGKLNFNEIAMALRVIADSIDTDQYMHGANSDFAGFLNFMKSVDTPENTDTQNEKEEQK